MYKFCIGLLVLVTSILIFGFFNTTDAKEVNRSEVCENFVMGEDGRCIYGSRDGTGNHERRGLNRRYNRNNSERFRGGRGLNRRGLRRGQDINK